MTERLGLDVGGVIIDRVNDAEDTSFFGNRYLETTAVPGVFAALRTLADARFGGEVYLVSKCGRRVQERTLEWLAHHDFYAATSISPEQVHFCRKRADKAGVCSELGITHFVDDRLEVLSYLHHVPHRYLFQPSAEEVRQFAQFLPHVVQVASWAELLQALGCASTVGPGPR
jgi:hypothetical protein